MAVITALMNIYKIGLAKLKIKMINTSGMNFVKNEVHLIPFNDPYANIKILPFTMIKS